MEQKEATIIKNGKPNKQDWPARWEYCTLCKLEWTYGDKKGATVDMSNDSNADKASEFSRQVVSQLCKDSLNALQDHNNLLFKQQEKQPGTGWEQVADTKNCWIQPRQNKNRTVAAISDLLEACGVTSATLTYSPPNDPKKFGFNRIIFGAPGTGKSWILNQDVESCFKAKFERVTFHPEYTYFDFVGSYKPVMNGKNIQYKFVAGPFARMLRLALDAQKNNSQDKFCLIVEEINRARVAAVFGDIFQLLDRKENGESEYEIMPSLELARYLQNNHKLEDKGIKPIRIPNNLYIWATMNSADQGVYPLDTAFKRRWSMEYIPYNPPEGKILPDDKWNPIRTGINELLLEKDHVNEDKLMGYYFLKEEERTGDKLKDALRNKVLMYLFDDAAKPCRKEIFIEGKQTFSELRDACNMNENNLGIFKADVWNAPQG